MDWKLSAIGVILSIVSRFKYFMLTLYIVTPYRFAKDEYNFGADENTTFYVYVYDFETPLEIVVSFSQHPKLDLLQFFITFST